MDNQGQVGYALTKISFIANKYVFYCRCTQLLDKVDTYCICVCVPGTFLSTGDKSGEQYRKSSHPLRAQFLM